jgi:hypothetical protein
VVQGLRTNPRAERDVRRDELRARRGRRVSR